MKGCTFAAVVHSASKRVRAMINYCCDFNHSSKSDSKSMDESVKDHTTSNGQVSNSSVACVAATNSMSCTTLTTFRVEVENLSPNESVGLTGNINQLGNWSPNKYLKLDKEADGNTWSSSLIVSTNFDIQYRYFTYMTTFDGKSIIRNWETTLQPRTFHTQKSLNETNDIFGVINEVKSIHRGWLSQADILQFKLYNNPFKFNGDMESFYMKIELHSENMAPTTPTVEVSKLTYGDSKLKPQPENGILYESNSIVVFHISEVVSESYSYIILIYSKENQLMGRGIVTSTDIIGSEGVIRVVIRCHSTDEPLGNLNLYYLIITPLRNSTLNFRTTFAHYWNHSRTNLDIGHRGLGASFRTDKAAFIENTLAAFKKCSESKADFIELDVNLTKDFVPVVYHDFDFYIFEGNGYAQSLSDLTKVDVKDFYYDDLLRTEIYHVVDENVIQYPSAIEEKRKDHRLFPRLSDVMEEIRVYPVAIDIEIKWPQALADGTMEAEQTIDKNRYVDEILNEILKHGQDKFIVITSFDADICTMVRFKQNLYPVMFLSLGRTTKWTSYVDPRCNDAIESINNAQAFELIGTGAHTEDIIADSSLVQSSLKLKQVMFLWGDDSSSLQTIEWLKQTGIHGLIYDRVDKFLPFLNEPVIKQ